eukprot:2084021-Prymnesium_polylepis.1
MMCSSGDDEADTVRVRSLGTAIQAGADTQRMAAHRPAGKGTPERIRELHATVLEHQRRTDLETLNV